MTVGFRVAHLDHVELFVPDRAAAAAWYREVLGLEPVAGTEAWAADPHGPLMISPDGGRTMLALFAGEPQGTRPAAGICRIAFRVGAAAFLEFVARARAAGLREGDDPLRVRDHATAFSAYFSDPYGNRLEVTTYDHAEVRAMGAPGVG
jgi:catechol 2,3-dioxygenase-like lactoylglutathione lyase family enzyme